MMRLLFLAIVILVGGLTIINFLKAIPNPTNPIPQGKSYEQTVKDETRALVDAIPYRCLRAAPYNAAKGTARFDILGMRLYMSAGEIISVANATGLFNRDMDRANGKPCLSEKISKSDKKSCIEYLTLSGDNTSMSIGFVEDTPAQPGCVAAYSIKYRQNEHSHNDASLDAWERMLSKKYGASAYGFMRMPYNIRGPTGTYSQAQWGNWGGTREPSLLATTVIGYEIKLIDDKFKDDHDNAEYKAQAEALPTFKPRL